MSVLGSLLIFDLVVGVLLWYSIFRNRRSLRQLTTEITRWREVSIVVRLVLGWPVLLIATAFCRDLGRDIAEFLPPVYRISKSRSAQRIDEVGYSARVRSSRSDGAGRLIVDLVSGDFRLVPDRGSGGAVCSVAMDRWTISQLIPLLDRAVYTSPRDLSVGIDWTPSDVWYLPDVDSLHCREYLHRLVEVGGPPVHPLLAAAIASLVAASEASDLGVMSREEIDVVDSILDFATREDKSRITRAVAILIDDLRLGSHKEHKDRAP